MRTYSFIGSDKNCGKTTAYNYVYRQLYSRHQSRPICLSSIGINGEDVDNFEGIKKPHIDVLPHSYFITHASHLAGHTGKYKTLLHLGGPFFSKSYIFGRALLGMQMVLEGPNRGSEIDNAKQQIKQCLGDDGVFLIDGSIDRQFLARPEISDGFYFSVLFTKDVCQFQKSCNFLQTISLAPCCKKAHRTISENVEPETKSLLFTESGQLIYRGKTIVSQDIELREKCATTNHAPGSLYLRGALTPSLYTFLAPFEQFRVILDNFTFHLNINSTQQQKTEFKPDIFLYHPVVVKNIFLKQETYFNVSLLPPGLTVKNLFREIHHEG
jgi:hypothetical protein